MAAYNQTPEGLPGNDDAGEMSAWYVLAALGLYHTTPGVPVWALSSPAFPRAVLRLSGRSLDIEAPGASPARPYLHRLTLNGTPVERAYLTTCQLRRAHVLRYALGPTPDRAWASSPPDAPPSATKPDGSVSACTAALAAGGSG